jgi:uncharacterized repeat protein (TIGR03803 family)
MRSKYTRIAGGRRVDARSSGEHRQAFLLIAMAGLSIACGYGGAACAATTLQVLMSFGHARGTFPLSKPVEDANGNLYVTSDRGGAGNGGAVVELSPPAPGATAWTKRILYALPGDGGEYGGGALLIDAAGNLYGVNGQGGTDNDGYVYELSPPARGRTVWKQTVLHNFDNADGAFPSAAMVEDGMGNLYGTTNGGGAHGFGVVFELSPPVKDEKAWKETVIHSFDGVQGEIYASGVILGAGGALYATEERGGTHDAGVVYQFSAPVAGQARWQKTILHNFGGADGEFPQSPLLTDAAGNLYGTAGGGGAYHCGLVFELSPPGPGQRLWKEMVLHTFRETGGCGPLGGVIADSAGILYGTTAAGGINSQYGSVFALSPPAPGATAWKKTVLHRFNGAHGDGGLSGLAADGSGAFYGTAQFGGKLDEGMVFKLTP